MLERDENQPRPATDRRWPLSSLIALVGFLFVPFVLTVTGLVSDDQPNDSSAADQIDGLMFAEDASETAEFERWLEDRVPGRELAAEFERTTSRILDDRYVQAVTDSDQVLLGQEGWLFLAESAQQPCITPTEEAAWIEEIDLSARILAHTGRRMVIAITPDKEIIVPELLGDIANECQQANRAVVERLAMRDDVISLATSVRGQEHALKLDTHWSPAGALAAARPIVDEIRPGVWEDRELTATVVDRSGDLDRLIGYDHTETVELVSIAQPIPTVLEPLPTSIEGRPLVRALTEGAEPLDVLVAHDSFGGLTEPRDPYSYRPGLAIDYLRPWFVEVANMQMPGISSNLLGEAPGVQAVRWADVIAFLFVQRQLPVRLGTGQLSAPLISALEPELSTVEVEFGPIDGRTVIEPPQEGGALIIDGLPAGSAVETAAAVNSGAIVGRGNFDDRVVLLVEPGTEVRLAGYPTSVAFLPFATIAG